MSRRSKQYAQWLAACRAQTTRWLEACYADPPPGMPLVRLALRTVLRERKPSLPVDISWIDGCKLSNSIRCF